MKNLERIEGGPCKGELFVVRRLHCGGSLEGEEVLADRVVGKMDFPFSRARKALFRRNFLGKREEVASFFGKSADKISRRDLLRYLRQTKLQ